MTTHQQDCRLVARLAQSDDHAWIDFLERFEDRILAFCRSLGLQNSDAHDVAQNVLLRVLRAIERLELDGDRGTLWHWIAAITYREILRHTDRQRLVTQGVGGQTAQRDAVAPSSAGNMESLSRLYDQAMVRTQVLCRPADWRVFLSVWIGGTEPHLIAAREGQTTQWVYRAKFRALEHLRHEVELLYAESAIAEPA